MKNLLSIIALTLVLAAVAITLLCTIPSDPSENPGNIVCNLFIEDGNYTVENGSSRSVKLELSLQHLIDSVSLWTSCGNFDTLFVPKDTSSSDTLCFFPVFFNEGPCTLFVHAGLKQSDLNKTDQIIFHILPPAASLAFSSVPDGYATRVGNSDTLLFSVATEETAGSVSFSVTSEPAKDSTVFNLLASDGDNRLRVVFTPDTAGSFTLNVVAAAESDEDGILRDTAVVGIRVYDAFSFSVVEAPQIITTDSPDTLLFIVDNIERDDSLRLDLIISGEQDTGVVHIIPTGGDTLMIVIVPDGENTLIFEVVTSNGVIADTTSYSVIIAEAGKIVWTAATVALDATEGKLLELRLRDYLTEVAGEVVTLTADRGTIEGDSVWRWLPYWGCAAEYTATLTAYKGEKHFDLKLAITVAAGDSTAPVIRVDSPDAADKTIGSSQVTVKAVVIDDKAGVAEVLFIAGTDTVEGTVSADSIYTGVITGLISGVKTAITIRAVDNSMKGNCSEKTITVIYDTTMGDGDGPVFIHVSGPKSSDRVTTDSDTIVYTITDDSGVDSVWWTLGGSGMGALTGDQDNNYRFGFLFESFGSNRIVLYARDGSDDMNVDSQELVLDYNTLPLAVTLNAPEDGATGVDTLPTFTWNGGDDADGDPVFYRVFYGTADDALTSQSGELENKTFTITAANTLTPLTTWYWRVIAWSKEYPDTVISPVNSFTTLDQTADDLTGPTITQQSGPESGEVISNAQVTIDDMINDPSGIASVTWALNNGTPQNMEPVSGSPERYSLTTTLPSAGTYTIVITATDNSSLHNQNSQTIILEYVVSPQITGQSQSGAFCSGEEVTVSVTATGTPPLHYQWRNGNGNIIGATDANYTISSLTATMTLTCVVSNAAESATSDPIVITMNPSVSIIQQPASTTYSCPNTPATISVSATGGNGLQYQWYRGTPTNGSEVSGSGYSGMTSATLTVPGKVEAEGNYYCVVTNDGGCSEISNTGEYKMNHAVSVVLTSTSSTTCPGENVTFSATPTGGSSHQYQWYRDGSKIGSPSTLATYSTSTAGTYSCTAISSEGCKDESNEVTLTLNTMSTTPTIRVKDNGSTTICSGAKVVLEIANGQLGTGASWHWFKGSAPFETGASFITDYPTSQTTYSVKGVGACGESAAGDITIDMKREATAAEIEGPTSSTCPGNQISLFRVGGDAGEDGHWVWRRNSVTGDIIATNTTSISVTPETTTDYYLVAEGGCNTVSTHVKVTVDGPTIVSQTTGPIVIPEALNPASAHVALEVEVDGGSGGYIYQWYLNGETISESPLGSEGYKAGENLAEFSFAPFSVTYSGEFTCEITDSYGCTIYSDPVSVTIIENENN